MKNYQTFPLGVPSIQIISRGEMIHSGTGHKVKALIRWWLSSPNPSCGFGRIETTSISNDCIFRVRKIISVKKYFLENLRLYWNNITFSKTMPSSYK